MRKSLIRLPVVLLSGLLSCTPVMAGSFSAGAGIGVATGGEDASSLNQQLIDSGFTASASTSGDIRTSWKTFIAYHFDEKWGVNLSYIDLGEATVSFSGINVPIDVLLGSIGEIHPRTAQGTKLSVSYQHQLNKSMHVRALLGVFDWDASYSLNGVNSAMQPVTRKVEQMGTDVSVGFGLVHRLTNDMSWHIDWDFYEIDSEPVNVFSFALSYKFKLR